MSRHQALILLFAATTLACDRHAVPPEERRTLALVTALPSAPGAVVDQEILDCGVAQELIDELEDEIDQRFNVQRIGQATRRPGLLLGMRFIQAEGAGGGMLSGPKRLAVEGVLYEDGVFVASFTARRTGWNGFKMGYYQGTCSMVEDLAEELAEDIADWLLAPRHGAELGDV